jgi:hypothetical protein
MHEFGEPNMGNPSVRFDEGRSGTAALTTTVSSSRLFPTPPTLLSHTDYRIRPAKNSFATLHPRALAFQPDSEPKKQTKSD